MTEEDASESLRERWARAFSAHVSGADGEPDLVRAALLASSALQGRDVVDEGNERLAHCLSEVSGCLDVALPPREAAITLGRCVATGLGLRGNASDYYDPRNSFLDQVLERRLGIPVSLGLAYRAIAAPAGLEVDLLAFPGHVLLRVGGVGDSALLDPFDGCLVERADCEALLARLGQDAPPLQREHFRPLLPSEILMRLLGNLKHIYMQRRDYARCLTCCEWMLLIDPRAPQEMLDKALLYEQLECLAGAQAGFRHFLLLHPGHRAAAAVRARLEQLERGGRGRLH